MKTATLAASLLILITSLSSCKKEIDSRHESTFPITGLWIGTYNIQEAYETGDTFYYSFFIRNDDSLQVQGQGADGNTYYGFGTWELNDSIFNATITTTNLSQQGAVQKVSAIFDKKKGQLKEGRVETTQALFLASFSLTRVN